MHSYKKCIQCFFDQAERTALLVGADEKKCAEIKKKISNYLKNVSFLRSPADLSNRAIEIACEVTGTADPYLTLKKKYNRIAKKLYPKLMRFMFSAKDKLLMAIKLAIAGNIIDLGILIKIDIDKTIKKAINSDLTGKNYKLLKQMLERPKSILYICDNAGEIVFDRILVNELAKKHNVTVSVKSGPVINDAMMEDAEYAGITKLAKVITTGNNCLGVVWRKSSKEFKKAFKSSDLIISKGQANYETLEGFKTDRPIFFLMQSKCPVVAGYMKVKLGEALLKTNIKTLTG